MKEIKEMTPEEAYFYLKNMSHNEAFGDKYPYAYVESERIMNDIHFISVTTGYNRNVYITLVIKDEKVISSCTQMLGNYNGYEIHLGDDGFIHETRSYGFGRRKYAVMDLEMNIISEDNKQSFGCCCG